ncbi:MAG: DUF3127 domain-containing protein [Bacteroidetes bacterium]|nr:DUF3127 domain-containing protein [Bacteroidota bacterium]
MDISGKLSLHLPIQSGEGKNGTWQKSGFVVETSNEKFPKKVYFTTWGDTIAQSQAFQIGEDLKVSFDVESREYQGKWYSDIKAWKVERNSGGATNAAPSTQNNTQNHTPNNVGTEKTVTPETFNVTQDDDLPF